MHHEIEPLSRGALNITADCPPSDPRSKFLGKRVRLRPGVWDPSMGTLLRDHDFIIREVQNDFAGRPVLRGYCCGINDTFGRCIDPTSIEIVDEPECSAEKEDE